jgi:carbonic anhydrase
VDPAVITDAAPGELFVIRNVANLVPPFESGGNYHGTSAALEFGVCNLGVENIIVLGHAQCGGIRALMQGDAGTPAQEGFVSAWMQVAGHARNRVLSRFHGESREKRERACEREAVLVSLDNLLTFPWILERVAQRKLALHGWYFDIEQGELLHYDPAGNRFEPFTFSP